MDKISKNNISEAIEHIDNNFDNSCGHFEFGQSFCPTAKKNKDAVVWIENKKTKLIIIINE